MHNLARGKLGPGKTCMFMGPLGDLIILAMQAAEVASDRCNRQAARTGMEVVQRLLFDRVDVFSNRATIDKGVELAVMIFSNSATPPPAIDDQAVKTAEIAADLVISDSIPESGWMEFHGFPLVII